ncbi:CoA transferase [Acuticoccus sediminis]|uniref:CoA transferase n=1 Tax=Acuticoccus sediminis TaxID=2184697 RepID=A0A8B2NVP8_9HYPH|nr:CoA transferase [Acuticoccus sediminis]RAI02569.1 CoA transferase [Acuticoccus sediminis]
MFASRPFTPDETGPLTGLKVLDLSRLVAGNMLSLQLADFGADVLKIEGVANADPLRDWTVEGQPLFWKVYCRNKRSLAVDLRQPDGMGILKRLIAEADVFIENFRPGTLEKMGLAPDALLALNPRLVVVRISGYGQTGPYRSMPGYGTLVEGLSGLATRLGFEDRPPILPPLALSDLVCGIYGAYATMVALQARTAEGGGQVVDLSLLETTMTLLGPQAETYRQTGRLPRRDGSRSEIASPRNVFRTLDGRWVSLSAPMQSMVERLFRTIGRADMIEDPRFATGAARLRNAEACEAPVAEFIAARDLGTVLALFKAADVTVAPVYDVDQVVTDPHVLEREAVVDLPDADLGRIAMHNVVPRLSGTAGSLRTPAPGHGEHSREVLADLGFADAEIDRLAGDGVILAPRGAASDGAAAQ